MIGIERIGFAFLLIEVVSRRGYLFFIQEACDLAKTVALTTIIEYLADNLCRRFVNDKLVFVIR